MRIFRSGVRKLIRRPATWLTFGLLAGLLALIMIAVGATAGQGEGDPDEAAALALVTFPTAYEGILGFIIGLGGLFAVIYGAAIAGSEWSWGTLKVAVARGESRSRYLLGSFASVAILIAVGLLFAFGVGVGAALVGAAMAGVPTDGIGDADALARLPEQFARGWFATVEEGALGFAVATLARSQLAGIGAGIAFYFAETFATIFLPDIVKYLPFHVANTAVGLGDGFGDGSDVAALSQETAMLLVAAWLIGLLVVAAAFAERAEITG
jgi:ABC-type transport system involved in multi-copper enzyme maturation permease subunit